MNFELTESEVIRLTGYSRQQLQRLRLGGKQVQSGREYINKPTLIRGKDWIMWYGRVLYATTVTDKLVKRKNKGW